MNTGDITTLIGNLGFPIFVAVYMMYQNSKLSETITDLKTAITELSTLLKNNREEE